MAHYLTLHDSHLHLVHSTLCDVSRVIESLQAVSGVQAFVLAVDPCDSSMNGFLGGSLLGRDFWRTLRGGGEAGAKAFKTHCLKHPQEQTAASDLPVAEGSHQTPAQLLKAELYDKVRVLLRYVLPVGVVLLLMQC